MHPDITITLTEAEVKAILGAFAYCEDYYGPIEAQLSVKRKIQLAVREVVNG